MASPVDTLEQEEEEESDDEVEMTAAEVLQKLEENWLNEKFSPEILETKAELVECMLEQVQQMEENIKKCKKGDVRITVHRMEIDRIRYVVSSYLRIRLEKIEKFHQEILHKESVRKKDEPPILSPEELAFAKEHSQNVESHMKNAVLSHLPPNFQTLDREKTAPKPDLDHYIFLRANRTQEQVLIEPELEDDPSAEVVDLEAGSQYIMRYRPLASLISDGTISLI